MIIGVIRRSTELGLRPIDSMAEATARPWPIPQPRPPRPIARPAPRAIIPAEPPAPASSAAMATGALASTASIAPAHTVTNNFIFFMIPSAPFELRRLIPRHHNPSILYHRGERRVLRSSGSVGVPVRDGRDGIMRIGMTMVMPGAFIVVTHRERHVNHAEQREHEGLYERHECAQEIKDHRDHELRQIREDLQHQMIAGHVAEKTHPEGDRPEDVA